MTAAGFRSGKLHPRYVPDDLLLEQLGRLPLGTLHLTGWVGFRGKHRMVRAMCGACLKWRILYVDNVKSGKTRNCTCQGKYLDSRAATLGQRYDAMIQRCRRWTHVSSKHYKGRGIRVLFRSREHFIRWALGKYPDSDFRGMVLDRINNDGHYSPKNLRLTTYSENSKNGRRWKR